MSSVNADVGRYCVPIALLQYYEMYLCTIVAFLVTQQQDFHSLAFGMEQLPNAIKLTQLSEDTVKVLQVVATRQLRNRLASCPTHKWLIGLVSSVPHTPTDRIWCPDRRAPHED
jgi:hypothetical protein